MNISVGDWVLWANGEGYDWCLVTHVDDEGVCDDIGLMYWSEIVEVCHMNPRHDFTIAA